MTLAHGISDDLRNATLRELAGEPIRWSGRPSARAAFWHGAPIWLFAVPWTVLSLIWEIVSIGGFVSLGGPKGMAWSWFGAFFVLFGLPFVAVGVGMLAAPFWLARRAARTVWAATDRRIASVRLGWRGVTVRSVWPRDVLAIERTEKADGSGTLKLVFGEGRDSDGDKVERAETIRDVPGVRRLEDILRRMIEERALSPSPAPDDAGSPSSG